MFKNLIVAAAMLLFTAILGLTFEKDNKSKNKTDMNTFNAKEVAQNIDNMRASTNSPSLEQLVNTYKGLGIIDAHNHDASDMQYLSMISTWNQNHIEKIVLF
jgi:hypothetical protein